MKTQALTTESERLKLRQLAADITSACFNSAGEHNHSVNVLDQLDLIAKAVTCLLTIVAER
jgi:hypothetical protein